MGAPCYSFLMTFGEDEWPNGCANDSTGKMKCSDCNRWCGGYSCPANDEIYYYRIEKGLFVGNYEPDMTKEELQQWVEEYNQKYKTS